MASASASTGVGYADLTPPAVLALLDAVGLHGDGRLLQLNSYENRVFQVFLEDGSAVVAKFYRPGRWSDAQILEEHAFALALAQREIPVVAPLPLRADDASATLLGEAGTLASVALQGHRHRFSVSPRRAGRAPELDDPATLGWMGRFIGRLHEVGAAASFVHRRRMDPATFGFAPRDVLLRCDTLGPEQAPAWRDACDRALALVQQAFDDLQPLRTLRLHGDCHPGNVLWRSEGPHIVDLDDACTGPAVQDLWMLLSGDAAAMAQQLRHILTGYRQFMDFDARELRLVEPLRTLRMIHHSAWIAERWGDPAFPAAFPWFGTSAYWSQQTAHLREQIEVMSEGWQGSP
jgi:Ser/Thr protein kinase RdoA (MazF antagonist)